MCKNLDCYGKITGRGVNKGKYGHIVGETKGGRDYYVRLENSGKKVNVNKVSFSIVKNEVVDGKPFAKEFIYDDLDTVFGVVSTDVKSEVLKAESESKRAIGSHIHIAIPGSTLVDPKAKIVGREEVCGTPVYSVNMKDAGQDSKSRKKNGSILGFYYSEGDANGNALMKGRQGGIYYVDISGNKAYKSRSLTFRKLFKCMNGRHGKWVGLYLNNGEYFHLYFNH